MLFCLELIMVTKSIFANAQYLCWTPNKEEHWERSVPVEHWVHSVPVEHWVHSVPVEHWEHSVPVEHWVHSVPAHAPHI